jgi:hypothetical protein
MSRIVTRRRSAAEPAAAGLPSPIESEEGRRITFLELMAWAVIQAESHQTREDWNKFQAEITANRIEHWLEHPWSRAKQPDAFERHVLAMARAFTTNGRYPLRRKLGNANADTA